MPYCEDKRRALARRSKMDSEGVSSIYNGAFSKSVTFTFNCCHSWSANFPVLNANIFHEKSGKLIAKPYTILEQSDVKIGVIGVMGIDAFYNTMAPFHRIGLSIKDPIETAQYWADKIRVKKWYVVKNDSQECFDFKWPLK